MVQNHQTLKAGIIDGLFRNKIFFWSGGRDLQGFELTGFSSDGMSVKIESNDENVFEPNIVPPKIEFLDVPGTQIDIDTTSSQYFVEALPHPYPVVIFNFIIF